MDARFSQAYAIKAMQAIQGVTFPVTRSLSIQVASPKMGVTNIEADTWVNQPHEAFAGIPEGSTVVIPVMGAMTKYDNCGYYGTNSYSTLLRMAEQSDNVKSVILDIDSPGGTADGSTDMLSAVSELSRSKLTVAYVNGMAASAAYRIAAGANMIVAKPGSVIGSIGTMVTLTDYTEYLTKMGIREINVYANGSPDKNKVVHDAIAGDVTGLQNEWLDPFNEMFQAEMRDLRNLPEEALTGKIYDPIKAKELGMIDAIGNLQDVINLLTGKISAQ
jgi:signal peptide peptidase SppA